MPKKTSHKMKVIPEPAKGTASVLHYTGKGATMKGPGSRIYACGKCGREILNGIKPAQIIDVIFRCDDCKTCNVIPPAHQGH